MDAITRAIADRWAGEPCYLDGAPAKITGRLNAYGTVAPLDVGLGKVEHSWHTINRVMRERGGFFETR